MTQHGPPPGWPTSPAAGEFGPGFTVAGDATLRSADGGLVASPVGPPPPEVAMGPAGPIAGAAPTQGTVADPGAIYAPVVPLNTAAAAPPAAPVIPPVVAAPVPVRRAAPKSRVPLLVGILLVTVAVMGGIAYAVTRGGGDSESEEGSAVPLPKGKKKKAKKTKETREAPPAIEPAAPAATPTPAPQPQPQQPQPTPTQPAPAQTGTSTQPAIPVPKPTALPTFPPPKPTSDKPPPKKRTPREQ